MSRRRLFGSLTAMVLLVNLGRVVFAPLVEPLKTAFVASNATIGLAVTLAWAGSALPRIPTGYLLTRVPRHRVVATTGLLLTGSSVFIASAASVQVVMVGAFLMGTASGAYFIAANPLVSELFPERVGGAIGLHGMANQVGAVIAPGLVVAALAVGSWRTVFHAIAVAAFCSTLAFVVLARRTDLPDAGVEDRDLLGAVAHQWRLILAGVLVISASGFVWQGLFNFYVTYMQVRGFTSGTANLLLTGVFAAGIPAFALTGLLADRVPLVPLLLTVLGSFAACVLALTLPFGTAWLVGVSLVMGYVVHSLFPAMDTFMLGSLPDHHRASAYAVYSGVMMVIQATAPSVVGAATDAGVAFTSLYRVFGLGLVVVTVGLALVHAVGRLPTGARV